MRAGDELILVGADRAGGHAAPGVRRRARRGALDIELAAAAQLAAAPPRPAAERRTGMLEALRGWTVRS